MARNELGTQIRFTDFESGSLAGEVNAGRLPSWQLPNGSITGPGFIEQVVQSEFKSSGNNAIKIRVNTAPGDTGCRIYLERFTNNEFMMVADAMIPQAITSNRFYNIFQIKQQHSTGSHLVFETNVRIRGGNNSGGPMQPVSSFGQWHWGFEYNTDQPDPYPIQSGLNITVGQLFRMKMRIKKNLNEDKFIKGKYRSFNIRFGKLNTNVKGKNLNDRRKLYNEIKSLHEDIQKGLK
jgi:hypothetical protein